ncbi:putative integral membrane protein [Acidovorax sp. 69]|uniref:LapA family protein n=1 Tax=Acidovorax sp. 69 TaxID=2035202 RepID=UPI000C250AF0|nr:LapA family protein [Acidovorax sp. 69]PJI97359.1 putative integral membrane protein [Acidovorax sp. 69]
MKYLLWLLKAAIFFTLFAFALNNQQDATVHFFFGTQWRAPLVLVVLTAFSAGLAVGVLGMVPRWWRHRTAARRAQAAAAVAKPAPVQTTAATSNGTPSAPPPPPDLPSIHGI